MSEELGAIADIVGLVVFGVGKDHEDAVGGEVVHLAPKAWSDEQALGVGTEYDALLALTVEEAESDGASDANTELVELLVSVEAAAHAGRSAVNPIDSSRSEGEDSAEFGYGETATGVASLGDVDKLNEGHGHRPWAIIVRRYSP
jgi:hypothetical protein